jgi:hypothetical protein
MSGVNKKPYINISQLSTSGIIQLIVITAIRRTRYILEDLAASRLTTIDLVFIRRITLVE